MGIIRQCAEQAHRKLKVIKDEGERNKPPTASFATACQGTAALQHPLTALRTILKWPLLRYPAGSSLTLKGGPVSEAGLRGLWLHPQTRNWMGKG